MTLGFMVDVFYSLCFDDHINENIYAQKNGKYQEYFGWFEYLKDK